MKYVYMARCESRKETTDGAWLNPKRQYNGQSAAKSRIEKSSTTNLWEGVEYK